MGSALLRRPQRVLSPLLPHEDTMTRWPSVTREMGSHQTLNLLVP